MSFKRLSSLILLVMLFVILNQGNTIKILSASEKSSVLRADGDLSPILTAPRDLASYAKQVAERIDMNRIKEHIRYLSNLGTRCPGTDGYYKAAEYIKEKFEEYGLLNVSYQNFEMAMPVSHGAWLEVVSPKIDENIVLEPFLPNAVFVSDLNHLCIWNLA